MIRGWLLLAHADFLEGARTDACERYELALRANEGQVRGDLYAVHDLARMAAHQRVGERAAALLQRHWGVRALPAIDRAMTELDPRGGRESPARLTQLREQLVRSSTLGLR